MTQYHPASLSFRAEQSRVEKSPSSNDAPVFQHRSRNLFINSFLSDMTPLYSKRTGNFSHTVSYPACHLCASHRQETFRKQFPVRLATAVFHTDRKLFANSFLSGMTPLCRNTGRKPFAYSFLPHMTPLYSIPTGNFSQTVSYPACHLCFLHLFTSPPAY